MSLNGPREDTLRLEAHAQHRHRITMACEECRRRKIKCTGKKPCPHCLNYKRECIYNISKAKKKQHSGAASRIEELAHRVNYLEGRLRAGNGTPNKEAAYVQDYGEAYRPQAATLSAQPVLSEKIPVDTVLDSKERLCFDNEGNLSYSGNASYHAILQKLQDISGRSLNLQIGRLGAIRTPEQKLFEQRSSGSTLSPDIIFPLSKDRIMDLVSSALDKACAMDYFIHRPEFDRLLKLLFDAHSPEHSTELQKFVPLFYAVLALGCLFSHNTLESSGFEGAIHESAEYFKRSRGMLDIITCKDITSLQTVVVLNMYLECTGKLTHCYSYLAVTITLALRMGLHRSISAEADDIQSETRRRVFWAIRNMETRLSVLLGLPRLLGEDDIDQDMSREVSRAHRFANGREDNSDEQLALETTATACRELTQIIGRVVKDVYTVKVPDGGVSGIYSVSYAEVQKFESELVSWKHHYPYWLDDSNTSPNMTRSCYTLRLFYMHIKLMLYRPFLHYISRSRSNSSDHQAHNYAYNCINVSRTIIYLGREMINHGYLTGAYWFEFYTVLSAVLTIMFPILARHRSGNIYELLRVARIGQEILKRGGHGSRTANSSYQGLCRLFDRLELILKELPDSSSGDEQNTIRPLEQAQHAEPKSLNRKPPIVVHEADIFIPKIASTDFGPSSIRAETNYQPNSDSSPIWRHLINGDSSRTTPTLPEMNDSSKNVLTDDQSSFLLPSMVSFPNLPQNSQSRDRQDRASVNRSPNPIEGYQNTVIAQRQQETIQLLPYSYSVDVMGLGDFQDINILDMLNMEAWDESLKGTQDDLLLL